METGMEQYEIKTNSERSRGRLQSIAIICTVFMVGIAPYAILFALRVPIYGWTQVFYYFDALVILPFLAVVGVVAGFRLVERNIWRGYGIALVVASIALCLFVLLQWTTFDLLLWKRTIVPQPWKAIVGGAVVALVVYFIAIRAIGDHKRKPLAQVFLVLSVSCVAVSAFHGFQFLPRFLEHGSDLNSLRHNPAEDMLDAPAPTFSLQTLQGETYNFERDRGKVILLNFWATWCGPCIAELPHLEEIYRELGSPHTAFLAVSVDWDTSRVKPFIDSLHYSFTILYGIREVAEAYRLGSIPATFLIDKKGIIRKVQIGYDEKVPKKLRNLIQELLDE